MVGITWISVTYTRRCVSTNDLLGIDYAWIGIDPDGHVAVFTSAGAGPIPRWFADDRAWCAGVLEFVDALPARGSFQLHVPETSTTPGLTDWKRWAAAGLYAYDWLDVHRPSVSHSRRYEAIATPTCSIEVHVMPSALRDRPLLTGVCFAKDRLVDVLPFA